MIRFVLSTVALAGVLVTALSAFADPFAATASDHVQAAAAATQQPAPPAQARASSSDATAPAGFGWG